MALNSSVNASSQFDPQLNDLNQQIATTQQNLAPFQTPTSYLDLLGKIASASFHANADTIAFRASARRQLYGHEGFKPANFSALTPEQQATIQNSSRSGLLAAIQASQETETARQSSITNFLQTEGGRYADQAKMLTDSLNALISRRSELEQQKQQAQSESRQFFLSLAKDFPDMLASLNADEQNKLFQGTADDKLLSKVGQLAQRERDRRLYASSGGGTALSKLRIPAGYSVRLQVPIPGKETLTPVISSNNPETLAKYRNNPNYVIKNGVDVYKRTVGAGFAGGGVDFYGPKGKMTREQWTNETGVSWQDAAQAAGSTNPQDYPGSTTANRLTAADRSQAQSQAYNFLSSATDSDNLNAMVQQLLNDPQNQDYFNEIQAAAKAIASLKNF